MHLSARLRQCLQEAPLPDDWDADAIERGSFRSRLRYAVQRAKKLGRGSSRVALEIEYEGRMTVLKVATNAKGLHQNAAERAILGDTYAASLEITIPLIDSHDIIDAEDDDLLPTWLHVEKASRVTRPQLEKLLGCTMDDLVRAVKRRMSGGPAGPADNNPFAEKVGDLCINFDLAPGDVGPARNWGVYQGKPVLIDVGGTREIISTFYTKSPPPLRQVFW